MYETVLEPDSAILNWCFMILNKKKMLQAANRHPKVDIFPCTQI